MSDDRELGSAHQWQATASGDGADIIEASGSLRRSKSFCHIGFRSRADLGIYGFLDLVDPAEGLEGWIVDRSDPTRRLRVAVLVNDVQVGSVMSGIDRPDVAKGFGSEMKPGFMFRWDAISQHHAKKLRGGDEMVLNLCLPETGEILVAIPIQPPIYLQDSSSHDKALPRVIAFYLPQYHPIPENDLWWGKGFTEWHNVARGTPAFPGHYQPHIPGELGFYDLRVPETRKKQAELASFYGIHGFCYYYYWFSGKKLLDLPLAEVIRTGEPDFPFCICWANETWSRRWDGSDSEVLLAQEHTPETDEAFIREVIPILQDKRYIRVDDCPILLIYRVSLFPNATDTAAAWRSICLEHGFNIHLCAVESFEITDPAVYGFDSSVEFPPHKNVTQGVNSTVTGLDSRFAGGIFDYAEFVGRDLRKTPAPYVRYKGLMLGWDNTARRGMNANMFINSSPATYEAWLNGAIEYTRENLPPSRQLIFINAWNEWAEGTHLEPDMKYGTQFLEATSKAIHGNSGWKSYFPPQFDNDFNYNFTKRIVEKACAEILIRDRVIAHLSNLVPSQGMSRIISVFNEGDVSTKAVSQTVEEFYGNIDRFGTRAFHQSETVDTAGGLIFISGWFVFPGINVCENSPFWLILTQVNTNKHYQAFVCRRCYRADVSQIEGFKPLGAATTDWSGFNSYVDFSHVSPGEYKPSALMKDGEVFKEMKFRGRIYIV